MFDPGAELNRECAVKRGDAEVFAEFLERLLGKDALAVFVGRVAALRVQMVEWLAAEILARVFDDQGCALEDV